MNKLVKFLLCGVVAIAITPCYADDDIDDMDSDIEMTDIDESRTVAERMDCNAIKVKIDELSSDGVSDELSELQLKYRKNCVGRVGASRVVSRKNANKVDEKSTTVVAEKTESVEISDAQKEMCEQLPEKIKNVTGDTQTALQSTYDEYCNGALAPDVVIKTTMVIIGTQTITAQEPVITESQSATDENIVTETEEEKYARISANLDAGLCPDGTKPNRFGCCEGEKFTDLGNLEFACCPQSGGDCYPPVK